MTEADRKGLIHCARVFLREARARRGTPFARSLLRWAANARRQAAAAQPRQKEMRL